MLVIIYPDQLDMKKYSLLKQLHYEHGHFCEQKKVCAIKHDAEWCYNVLKKLRTKIFNDV